MKQLLSIILAIGVIGFGSWIFLTKPEPQPESEVTAVQTEEGLEFVDWVATSTEEFSFKYPQFSKTYISAVEWPPKIEKQVESYSCKEVIGTEIKEAEIDGVRYCVTVTSEGAAGSVYKTYVYKREGLQATFSLRFPQCLNYEQGEQAACIEEQENLDIDLLLNKILGTVTLK